MASRTPISKRLRFEIFKRDSFTCQYCGATPPRVILHIDHITPVSDGGDNTETNLITACEHCNLGKSDKPLTTAPLTIKEQADLIQEKEEQLRGYSEIIAARKQRIESEALQILDIIDPEDRLGDRDWYSAQNFVEKLGYHSTVRAAELAVSRGPLDYRDRFKYFCGICWNWIKNGIENS